MFRKRRQPTPLETALGYRFRAPKLLEVALTHRSYANEQELPENYERLEFLGDAVLGLIAAEWLYRHRPDLPEGDLSKLKSHLVSTRTLARHAEEIGLGEALRVGVGEERTGGRNKPSLLADCMEAVFGAISLDGGIDAAREVIVPMLEAAMEEHGVAGMEDAKTRLQELVQARGWELPDYRLAGEFGPDHDKRFAVECWIRGRLAGKGQGRTKKVAEQEAAAAALGRYLSEESGAPV